MRRRLWGLFLVLALGGLAPRTASAAPPSLETVQRRAFDFFWNETDPLTGLTQDRAQNGRSVSDAHPVASTAATGYALAALPIGVSHGWITRAQGYARALTTLRFLRDRLPNKHGFFFHFIERETGARVWNSELSSVDTALLLLGVRAAAGYWPGTEAQRLADDVTSRVDWVWMQNNPTNPAAPLEMGWKPESGWLPVRWAGYSEASFLYLLAIGGGRHPLPRAAWDAWQVEQTTLEGTPVFGGAQPLFMAEMAAGYIDLRGLRDRQGRDWWTAWHNAVLVDHAYCARNPEHRLTYAEGFWGVNANDLPPPVGYGANRPADGQNDGTVAPTAMLAAVLYAPDLAQAALSNLWTRHGSRLWGRYGFSNAFSVDRDWYDVDVIGIDLGMMLLAVENARTGLIWRLLKTDPFLRKGLAAAGFRPVPPPVRGAGSPRP